MKNCDEAWALLAEAKVITADAVPVCAVHYPCAEITGFQGGCSDGSRYYYLAMMHYDLASGQEDNYTRIAKLDLATGEVVRWSRDLRLHHANDIAYDSVNRRLVVCHNKPHNTRLTLIDADTLEPARSLELPFGIYSIDYHAGRNLYVVGLSGTWDFRLLNADFSPLDDRIFHGTPATSRYTKQGVCADDRLIYFILWDGRHKDADDFQNEIAVYDWDGNFKGIIEFDVGVKEPENLSIVNGEILAVCADKTPVWYRITPRRKA